MEENIDVVISRRFKEHGMAASRRDE